MLNRPPRPELLTDYEAWAAKGPPHFCHNCDWYTKEGHCDKFDMRPPDDFASTLGACDHWIIECPF